MNKYKVDLHKYTIENKSKNELKKLKPLIENSRLLYFDGNDICNKRLMFNVICNSNKQQCLLFTHGSKMVNEYNNPNLLAVCMFPTLFPYGLGALKMSC